MEIAVVDHLIASSRLLAEYHELIKSSAFATAAISTSELQS
jgi:hypothetical protein